MNEIEAKIRDVQWDISQIGFEIKNAKDVQRDERLELQDTADVVDFGELEPFKREIERLRKLSKKLVKHERVRFQKEKVMQEYMFQLERKRGKFTGEYMPEIKSYANKNYQPDPKYERKKDSDFVNYKP